MKRTHLGLVGALIGAAAAAWFLHGRLEPSSPPKTAEIPRTQAAATVPRDYREAYARATDDGERTRALAAAGADGTAEAIAWLVGIAASDPRLGARAASSLGAITNPAACAALDPYLAGPHAPIARANAERATVAACGVRALDRLAALAADGTLELRVRQEALLGLGKLREPRTVSAVVAGLDSARRDLTPEAEQLRIAFIEALGGIHTPEALAALRRYSPPTQAEAAFVAKHVGSDVRTAALGGE